MPQPAHHVEQYPLDLPGFSAMALHSARSFPRHTHDQFGIGLMTEGAHRSWSGVGAVEAHAGDIITVNPGEMHDGLPMGSACRGWRMLYFDPTLVAAAVGEETTATPEIERPVLRDPRLARLFDRLFVLLTTCPSETLAIQQNLLLLLAATTNPTPRGLGRAEDPRGRCSTGIARVRACLEETPDAHTSLADLAALAGMSRFQLIRAFAREVGATPHAYLIQRRVRLVQQLLASGHSAAEAAASAGFADQSHMSRAFVRQIGVTPGKYQAALS